MGTFTDSDLLYLLGEAGDSFAVPEDGAVLVLDALEEQAVVVPLHRRRWVRLSSAAAVAAVGVVLGVALFSGNADDRIGQLAGAPNEPAQGFVSDERTGTGGSEAQDFGPESASKDLRSVAVPPPGAAPVLPFSGGTAALADTPAPAAGGRAAALPQAAAAPPAAAPIADGARVVKKGAIALIVEDDRVSPTLTEVQGFAAAVGGVVANQSSQETGPTPSGSVTLRVPVDSFEEVVAQVRGMDAEVRSATTSGQDVTAAYADLEAQLRTLKAARERFLAILSDANSIGDVLAVQQRVDDVTGRLDRLEGERKVLAAQSDSATLEVTVTEADDPVVREVEEPDTGLSKAFSDAGKGFTTGVEALVRLSGRAVLLLLCGLLAAVVLRLAWRASRRRLV